MKKLFNVVIILVLLLTNVLPGIHSISPRIVSADAPTPPMPTTPTPPPAESSVANQPLPTPPSPGNLPAEVEQVRARQTIEAVLEKHLRYWGPRYKVVLVEVTMEGEWAHGVVEWQGKTSIEDGPIHVLARRLEGGEWQALMPNEEGLYLRWVEDVPESLVPVDEKGQLRAQAIDADALMRRPQLHTPAVPPATTVVPLTKGEIDELPEPVLRATSTLTLSISITLVGDVGFPGYNDMQSMRDPAAVHCLHLGYDYETVKSPDGGQRGICKFLDETVCDAWDFLEGKCGQDYSVCALEGLETMTLRDGNNPFSKEYAVCVDPRGKLLESVTDMINLAEKSGSSIHQNSNPFGSSVGPPAPPVNAGPQSVASPPSFDWRNYNGSDWTTPVKSQGQCGSCWAFSAVGVAETVINIGFDDPNLDLDLAEQYLVTDCALDAGACDGGYKGGALAYIRDNGIPDETCLPYRDGDWPDGCSCTSLGACDASKCTYHTGDECSDYRCSDRCSDWENRLHTIDSSTYFGYDPSKDAMKEALVAHGPLAVSLNMGGSFDQNDVYHCPSNINTGHAVSIVGYDDSGGYWVVRNSWGDTWGPDNNGYFKVAYDNCAIQKYPYYADFNSGAAGPLVYSSHTVDDDTNGQSDGNNDGVVNCGETIELYVDLLNQGSDAATGVNVTISTSDPYVTWLYNTDSSYPDIPGGGTGTNNDDFDFEVDSSTPDGHIIHFDLDVTASNGGPWSDSFDVEATCVSNNPPNTPISPSPGDGATDQSINVDLSWSGGDPDPGDTVTYDVYFEANDSTPDNLICNDVIVRACDPGTLTYDTHYYWYVVASDNHGASSTGIIWEFTTGSALVVGPLVYDSHTVDDDTNNQSDGNNDGVVNCGEIIELYVDLLNQGSDAATNVNATISTSDPYITFTFNTDSSYPNIPGGGTGTNNGDFDFEVDPDTPDGHVIHFDLDVTASNGGPWSASFDVPVTCVSCNDSHESNDTPGEATSINYGTTLSDPDICPAGDKDYYAFTASAGDVITADIDAQAIGSSLDPYLYLYDTDGVTELTHNDDYDGLDSYITYTLPADGTYYLMVREYNHGLEGGSDYFYTIFLAGSSGGVGPLVYDSYTVDDDISGESNGNDDGIVNCGETIELYVDLYNQGDGMATGVNTAISTSDSYITFTYNTDSSYPDIPSGSTGTNYNDFDFEVDPNIPDGHVIQFDLNIDASNGGPWPDSFSVPVVCPRPDLTPSQWGDWQYPVIPSSITGTNVVNTLYAGYLTYIDWGLTNAGNADTGGNTYGDLYIDDTRVGHYDFGDVQAGWTWAFFDWVEIIDTPGWHTLKSVADPDNLIDESDETNNIFQRDFYWTPIAPYTDDMESGTNDWTATGLWHQVDEYTSPYPESHSWSHSWWYGQDITGTYDTGVANSGDLTSPPIYIPDSGHYLRFWYWYETETQGADWDQRWVQISVDDGQFNDILQLHDDPKEWWLQSPVIDLSGYAGHTIQIRFHFDTMDSVFNGYRGWYIDDFDISPTPPPGCADSHEPNDTPAAATAIAYDQTLSADICPSGDYDYYTFAGTAGDKVVVDVDAEVNGSLLDSYIFLLDSDGTSVLAENDDEILAEIHDSHLGYRLPYTGTYYIKVKAWDHPSAGSADHFYTIHLLTDDADPSAEITLPEPDSWLNPDLQTITTDVSDDESGIRSVTFYWHDADWDNSDWIVLEDDHDPRDGWAYDFDTSGIPEQPQDCVVFIYAYDWAGNYAGYGSYHLGVDHTPPTATVGVQQVYGDAPFRDFWVNWWGYDNASGIADYDMQYRDGVYGTWTNLIISTTRVYTRFVGLDDHTYYFRARARDNADNQSVYAGGDGDVQHTVDICDTAPDAYEADNVFSNAEWITTDGISQTHNVHVEGNQDWVKFYAADGVTYTLATTNTGGHADTVLYLYDTDGSTLIDSNDDYPGMWPASRLDWQPTVSGDYYAMVNHWDPWAYGCTTEYGLSIVTNDEISPTGSVVINEGDTYVASSVVTLTIAGSDTGTGVDRMMVSNDSDFSDTTWMTYTALLTWTLTTGEGTRTVYTKFRDRAGNVSSVYSDTVILDMTPPTGSVVISGGDIYVLSRTVTLTLAADDVEFGVDQMVVANDSDFSGATWMAYASSLPWTLTAGDGTKMVYAKFLDQAGNVSSAYSDTIVLDTLPPTGSVVINDGVAYVLSRVVTLTLAAEDSGMGVDQVMIANNSDFSDTTWITHTTSLTWTLTTGEGTKAVCVKFRDRVGNISGVYSDTIVVYEPVEADFTASPTGGPDPLTVHFTDMSSGSVVTWEWTFGDGEMSSLQHPTYVYTVPGVYTVSLMVRLKEGWAALPGGTDTLIRTDYITVNEEHNVYLPFVLRNRSGASGHMLLNRQQSALMLQTTSAGKLRPIHHWWPAPEFAVDDESAFVETRPSLRLVLPSHTSLRRFDVLKPLPD